MKRTHKSEKNLDTSDEEIDALNREASEMIKEIQQLKRDKKAQEKLSSQSTQATQKPTKDSEGNAVFELNSRKKVRISKYKGQVLIDFREYWQSPQGETVPTKKGVSLTLDAYNQLKALIPSIDAQID